MNSENDAQLRELLQTPPPRHVRDDLARAIKKRQQGLSPLILGAISIIFIFFAFSLFPYGFWRDWQMAAGGVETVTGKVLDVESTKLKINKREVLRFTFEFQDPRSPQKLTGYCYMTRGRMKPGDSVPVEYLKSDPSISRIKGARQSASGTAGLLFILVPAAFLAFVVYRFRKPNRTIRLLEQGEQGQATVISIQKTNTAINKQTVMRITLERHNAVGSPELVVRFHQPAIVAYFEEHLSAQVPVTFLADPANPKKVVFPETLWLA